MNATENCISVSAVNGYIKEMLERDDLLSAIAISGEISNFKRNSSGHFYFSLKDEGATISAVMFRGDASRLSFIPTDGMKVVVFGRISLYEKSGQYQVYIRTMIADGAGELARAYEALKRKLESEGLFAPERKKKLPKLPRRIGIITSPTGAAIRDMINVTGRRYPLCDIVIFPAAVQGVEAPPQLRAGIEYFNAVGGVDVIIIGRGGGSIEDLWAFNDEALARAIAASGIPVISAVGHETDFTLCDFVADCRAPTPSAAAEIAVPDISAIEAYTSQCKTRFDLAIASKLTRCGDDIMSLERRVTLNSPSAILERHALTLQNIGVRMDGAMKAKLSLSGAALSEIVARLEGLNPMAVLTRGYSALMDGDGRVISSAKSLSVGESIDIVMADGTAKACVEAVTLKKA
ncbi:MAG: exodeoxyribonuclease VII large subunit [Clostridia bacterium]|nr:exodeoxyribonuclease VII large subunit [Clostridia bacterium]